MFLGTTVPGCYRKQDDQIGLIKKIGQIDTQPISVKISHYLCGNNSPRKFGLLLYFLKLTNNCPIGKKSPHLVTLIEKVEIQPLAQWLSLCLNPGPIRLGFRFQVRASQGLTKLLLKSDPSEDLTT
jgi:hypothetical protein